MLDNTEMYLLTTCTRMPYATVAMKKELRKPIVGFERERKKGNRCFAITSVNDKEKTKSADFEWNFQRTQRKLKAGRTECPIGVKYFPRPLHLHNMEEC